VADKGQVRGSPKVRCANLALFSQFASQHQVVLERWTAISGGEQTRVSRNSKWGSSVVNLYPATDSVLFQGNDPEPIRLAFENWLNDQFRPSPLRKSPKRKPKSLQPPTCEATPLSETLGLICKVVNGPSRSIHLPRAATVRELMSLVQNYTAVAPEQQRLVFESRSLDDADRTLESYGLKDGDTFHLLARLRGGAGDATTVETIRCPYDSCGELIITKGLAKHLRTHKDWKPPFNVLPPLDVCLCIHCHGTFHRHGLAAHQRSHKHASLLVDLEQFWKVKLVRGLVCWVWSKEAQQWLIGRFDSTHDGNLNIDYTESPNLDVLWRHSESQIKRSSEYRNRKSVLLAEPPDLVSFCRPDDATSEQDFENHGYSPDAEGYVPSTIATGMFYLIRLEAGWSPGLVLAKPTLDADNFYTVSIRWLDRPTESTNDPLLDEYSLGSSEIIFATAIDHSLEMPSSGSRQACSASDRKIIAERISIWAAGESEDPAAPSDSEPELNVAPVVFPPDPMRADTTATDSDEGDVLSPLSQEEVSSEQDDDQLDFSDSEFDSSGDLAMELAQYLYDKEPTPPSALLQLFLSLNRSTQMLKTIPERARLHYIEFARPILLRFEQHHAVMNQGAMFHCLIKEFFHDGAIALSAPRRTTKSRGLTDTIIHKLNATRLSPPLIRTPQPRASPPQNKDEDSLAVKQAITAYFAGHVGKAGQKLSNSSAGRADISDPSILKKANDLYPPGPAGLPTPPETPYTIIPNDESFDRFWTSCIDTGAAASWSGFRGEFGSVLLTDPDCHRVMVLITECILNGVFDDRFRPFLLAHCLHLLEKPGGIRPIVCLEVFTKSAEAFLSQSNKDNFGTVLGDDCFAAQPGGSQSAALLNKLYAESSTSIDADFVAAYQTIKRDVCLERWYASPELSASFRYVNWKYGKGAMVLLLNSAGKICQLFVSEEGLYQGGPISLQMFSVALKPEFDVVRADIPGLAAVTYVDDSAMHGCSDGTEAMKAIKLLRPAVLKNLTSRLIPRKPSSPLCTATPWTMKLSPSPRKKAMQSLEMLSNHLEPRLEMTPSSFLSLLSNPKN